MLMHRHVFTLAISMAVASVAVSAVAASASDAAIGEIAHPQHPRNKADSKAARAKKNAELSELQKNGYQPAGSQIDYPQNVQKAESKAAASKDSPASQ